MDGVIDVKVSVRNLPEEPLGTGYIVVRVCNLGYWYYGFYNTYERALYVAEEIGNGIVFGIIRKGDKTDE